MPTDSEVRSELQRLLRYANHAKVAKALGVSRATAARWGRGEAGDLLALEGVRRLLLDTTKEAPAPEWAEALAARTAEDAITRLVPPDLLAAAHLLIERLAAIPPPSAEAAPEEPESVDRVE